MYVLLLDGRIWPFSAPPPARRATHMAQSRGTRLDKTGQDTGPEPIKEDRPNRTEPSRTEPRTEPVDHVTY